LLAFRRARRPNCGFLTTFLQFRRIPENTLFDNRIHRDARKCPILSASHRKMRNEPNGAWRRMAARGHGLAKRTQSKPTKNRVSRPETQKGGDFHAPGITKRTQWRMAARASAHGQVI
jgi:hypothetical protein